MGANRAGNVKAIENLALATGVFQLEVVDDFGPGLTRVPVNAKPVMPSEPGEPSDPLEGASKAERRAWSKKHQAKEVRTWSSTNVRYLLSQGRIKDADAILGHAHAVEGTVVHGEERGRTIGFPTANLSENVAGYLPVDGVYAGWLVDLGEKSADGGEEAGEKPADGVSQQYDASSVNARVAMQSPHRWPAAISIGTKRRSTRTVTPNAWWKPTPSPMTGWTCTAIRRAWNSLDSCARRSNSIRPTIWWSS